MSESNPSFIEDIFKDTDNFKLSNSIVKNIHQDCIIYEANYGSI
jgi:hypothetical protein